MPRINLSVAGSFPGVGGDALPVIPPPQGLSRNQTESKKKGTEMNPCTTCKKRIMVYPGVCNDCKTERRDNRR